MHSHLQNTFRRTVQLAVKYRAVSKCRRIHTGPIPQSMLWLAGARERHIKRGADTSSLTNDVCHTPQGSECARQQQQQREQHHKRLPCAKGSGPPTLADVPPLVLDPPFTPVGGETAVMERLHRMPVNGTDAERYVVSYNCRECSSTLFSSNDFTVASTLGSHKDGWPCFTAPASAKALQLRGLLQRSAVGRGRGAMEADSNRGDLSSSREFISSPLTATLAARGLPIEGEMTRTTRSGRCELLKPKTWRDTCLRDVNKRSDPALLEGCCSTCGNAVCRVVTTRGRAVKYVVNPTAVTAELIGEEEEPLSRQRN
ncbi:hypothetical protein, conserved [Trypanosoma brucei gambiense DAL972]|uniref:Uncharacterized protein n=1 Tax=Trypanosoma brucei gambiense (strain MHOM/CI/86/DAL972) TaxID=679716 RepID=C9ZIZ9_TRYB9|nr:hypothetical protein, conserved [Trypanosoma brucei gambiense DAL972]CBH09357.1 hypothetical protein, conserved [Trypanosoma brucei gambiense DAL972]|eukprot:XP_011771663.1 hypothetical protein, conserved [Trypanosoma brucei gambiense DAL972]